MLCDNVDECSPLSGAVEMRFHLCGEFHHAGLASIKRIVVGAKDILAGGIFRATLADDNFTDANRLAVLQFNAEPLCDGVAA